MRALGWLMLVTAKNRLRELAKHPAQMVLVLLVAAMLVLTLVTGSVSSAGDAAFRPQAELRALILLLYAAMWILTAMEGLNAGASLFSMPDVNLVFLSPLSPRRILVYGLVRQMGTSVLLGTFLFFQYAWLHDTYGVSAGGLAAVFLGYCLTLFCGQMTAMVLYSRTAGNDERRRRAKTGMRLLLVLALLALAVPVLKAWSHPGAGAAGYPVPQLALLVAAADSPVLGLFPVAGWLKTAVGGMIAGRMLPALAGLCGTLAFLGGLIAVYMRSNPDYYEDVLQSTERSFSAVTAAKQGGKNQAVPSRVKVGRTGLGGGQGVWAFYYKHRLESRRSRRFLLEPMTLLWAAISIGMAVFLREAGVLAVFAAATYMLMFSVAAGRWADELNRPFVYLLPYGAFHRLLGICAESVMQAAAEAAVVMIPAGLIAGAGPLEVFLCTAARFSYALLFMTGYIARDRFFGQVGKTVGMFLVLLLLGALAAPGVVLAAAAAAVWHAGTAVVLLILAAWNLAAAALTGFICRDMLDYAELNNR